MLERLWSGVCARAIVGASFCEAAPLPTRSACFASVPRRTGRDGRERVRTAHRLARARLTRRERRARTASGAGIEAGMARGAAGAASCDARFSCEARLTASATCMDAAIACCSSWLSSPPSERILGLRARFCRSAGMSECAATGCRTEQGGGDADVEGRGTVSDAGFSSEAFPEVLTPGALNASEFSSFCCLDTGGGLATTVVGVAAHAVLKASGAGVPVSNPSSSTSSNLVGPGESSAPLISFLAKLPPHKF